MDISVIIPAWNNIKEHSEMTKRNIEQLWDTHKLTMEVIIIDNGSKYFDHYRGSMFIRYSQNQGVPRAFNAGINIAHGSVLVFANTDVHVEKDWDTALFEAVEGKMRIGFPRTATDGVCFEQNDKIGVAGWFFAVPRRVVDIVGTFDEQFSPTFYEDTDYFQRAVNRGVELVTVNDALVTHEHRRTSAQFLPNMDWLFASHRIKYAWKHQLTDINEVPGFWHKPLRIV